MTAGLSLVLAADDFNQLASLCARFPDPMIDHSLLLDCFSETTYIPLHLRDSELASYSYFSCAEDEPVLLRTSSLLYLESFYSAL